MTALDRDTGAGRASRPALVRVWDPFVRVFHWSLVAAFAIAWIMADDWGRLHELAGYAVAVLIGLRLVWGLVGTRHARFADFVYRPARVIAYLKDMARLRARRHLGHNPAAGAMVIALLLALAATSASGIMMTVDAYGDAHWVEELHEVSANLTIMLVLAHLAGVAISSLETRENLVRSMVTGFKRRDD